MFNFSHLQSTLQYLSRLVSTAQNSVWTHRFRCLSVLLPFCVSPLPHQQNVSLWGLFHPGNKTNKQNKSPWGLDEVNTEDGSQGSCCFGSKTAEHSAQCGQVGLSITHQEMGKHTESLQKGNSLKPNTASHINTSWYTDTYGFLENSPSGGSLYFKGPTLQKIIPVLGGYCE